MNPQRHNGLSVITCCYWRLTIRGWLSTSPTGVQMKLVTLYNRWPETRRERDKNKVRRERYRRRLGEPNHCTILRQKTGSHRKIITESRYRRKLIPRGLRNHSQWQRWSDSGRFEGNHDTVKTRNDRKFSWPKKMNEKKKKKTWTRPLSVYYIFYKLMGLWRYDTPSCSIGGPLWYISPYEPVKSRKDR